MSLIGSAPHGYERLGFRRLSVALLVVWLLPSVVAALALGAQKLLGMPQWGGRYLLLWASTFLMLLSPVLSWLGLILAAPIVAVLMDRGWFGWIPALLLGVAAGTVIALLMGHGMAISFGAMLLVMLRAMIGWLEPEAL